MSEVKNDTWTAADHYLADALIPSDTLLDSCLQANAAAALPSIDISPLQGKFLYLLAQIQGARRILEIGTLGGYSTIWLARALPSGGQLVTLELNPAHAKVARANIARAGLAGRVELIEGPAIDSLSTLQKENRPPFDLIFIDADKTGYPDYLLASLNLSRPGTVIIGDNVVRGGEVANPASTDANVRGAQSFIQLAASEPRLSSVVLQTVGQKGYDGFLLARVLP